MERVVEGNGEEVRVKTRRRDGITVLIARNLHENA